MKSNIFNIASITGVSPATVSNALNGKKGVSEKTKQDIMRIAKEIGYLKKNNDNELKKTIRFVIYKRYGMVVSDTPFFSGLIEGIEKECREKGYEVLISHISTTERDDKEILDIISKENTAGLLILATEMIEDDLEIFKNVNMPIVILDSYFKNKNFDSVLINNTDAAYKATEHLIQNGHKAIGYLHGSLFINNFHYRKSGFIDAMKDNNLVVDSKFEFCLEPTMEGAYRDMAKILETEAIILPTAFFSDNDIIAFGAIRALKENGKKIPGDISIIGLDDMPFCEITSPRLSTVKVFKQDIGSIAVRRLLEKIISKDYIIQKIEVNTELVIRDSVKRID